MMTSQQNDGGVEQLIAEHYGQPEPDKAFRDTLLSQLEAVAVRPSAGYLLRRRQLSAVVTMAVSVAVLLTALGAALLMSSGNAPDRGAVARSDREQADNVGAERRQQARPIVVEDDASEGFSRRIESFHDNRFFERRGMIQESSDSPIKARLDSLAPRASLGILPLAQRVGRCTHLVHAKLAGFDDGIATYDVDWKIYGEGDLKTVTFDLTAGGRRPGRDELERRLVRDLGNEQGPSVVLLLKRRKEEERGGKHDEFIKNGTIFEVLPEHPLEAFEDRVVKTIADGSFLEPAPDIGDVLLERMHDVDLIVRARLQKADVKHSTWKITNVIQGETTAQILDLDHDIYRRRAETIVAHRVRRGGRPDEMPRDDEIGRVARKMIDQELTMGREAILFVEPQIFSGQRVRSRLRHWMLATPDDDRLHKLEAAISGPQKFGL